MLRLRDHPRLYVGSGELERLAQPPRLAPLRAAERHVRQKAEEFVRSPVFDWPREVHNAHLVRARLAQTRIVTLLVRYFQTRQERFRRAAVRHVAEMGRWEYWSWITWRAGDRRPEAIFDLSYGENSATLALAYDWLADELTPAERTVFLDIALRRALRPFLANTPPKKRAWWFGEPDSNWNTVCAGGAGMLALAVYDELPEAAEVLRRAERSVGPFMRFLTSSDGAWPEGVGYWNYGMRYAFMYLLSHERATGRRHPLLGLPGARKTIAFPLDFCPNGVPASFGDVNTFSPLPFHYAAAARLRRPDVAAGLDRFVAGAPSFDRMAWPNAAEMLLLHPRAAAPPPRPQRHVVRLYRGVDWAVLADRLPAPRLYLSLRGGTTRGHHAHRDLTSFHCVVGGQSMVASLSILEYLDTTFSPRRDEIFETTPPAKNVVLINGVGITTDSSVRTMRVRVAGLDGILLDATQAMGRMRDGPAVRFQGRLVLLLPEGAILIADRSELPHTGRMESRLHTFGRVRLGLASAVIRRGGENLAVSLACSVPALLTTAVDAPTTPGPAPTMIRWASRGLHERMTMAMLLRPGARPGKLAIQERADGLTVSIALPGRTRRIRLSPRLR